MNDSEMKTHKQVSLKFTPSVGWLIRGSFSSHVKDIPFNYPEVKIITLEEDRRFLSSDFRIELQGPGYLMLQIKKWVKEYFEN